MERRDFLSGAMGSLGSLGTVAAAGTLASVTASTVHAQNLPNVTWRLTSSFPKSLDTIYGGAEQFARIIDAVTGGKFKISIVEAAAIAPAKNAFEAVQTGTVECAHTAGYYFLNVNKALAFDTTLPFGMNQRQHNAWVYQGGGLELLRDLFGQYNMVNFPMGNTGAQMGGWYNKEIRTLDDVKGLRIRIPGFGAEIWKRLGAAPVSLPGGEIAAALREKKIDAGEWVGPYDDDKLGLPAVARFY